MKYFAILLMFATLTLTGSAVAQSGSKLNGKTYTYVMKDVNGGEEIIDKFTFNNNTITSERLTSQGYKSSKVSEKENGSGVQFETTFESSKGGTMKFSGTVEQDHIRGTIIATDASGKVTNMAFRGMTTQLWEKRKEEKANYQKGKHE